MVGYRRGERKTRRSAVFAASASALKERIAEQGLEVEAKSNAGAIYAGAIGAAIWRAFRYEKLAGLGQLPKAS